MSSRPTEYSPLEDKSDRDSQSVEDTERLLSSNTGSILEAKLRKYRNISITACVLLPIISLLAFGSGYYFESVIKSANAICPGHVQKYSPILKEVDTGYRTVHFNGSFLKESVFRKEAGPEVDEAWESLGVNYRSLSVPFSEGLKSGLQASQVKISPKYGGGFPVNVEGLHHLHCLNLLRQSLYYNIDYYRARGEGAFKNDDNIVRHHVSHCLDIIRQQIMCTPDTGLLGQIWWDPTHPKAFVDFNTQHKCKNFDAIRKWAEERQISETVPMDFLEPPKDDDLVYDSIP